MSTVEVESVISSVLEQADSVVYGVDVPGIEGKAGMAAIVEEAGKFDLERFLNRIRAELPAYAIPLFIRLVSTIDITGTSTGTGTVPIGPARRDEKLFSYSVITYVHTVGRYPYLYLYLLFPYGTVGTGTVPSYRYRT